MWLFIELPRQWHSCFHANRKELENVNPWLSLKRRCKMWKLQWDFLIEKHGLYWGYISGKEPDHVHSCILKFGLTFCRPFLKLLSHRLWQPALRCSLTHSFIFALLRIFMIFNFWRALTYCKWVSFETFYCFFHEHIILQLLSHSS